MATQQTTRWNSEKLVEFAENGDFQSLDSLLKHNTHVNTDDLSYPLARAAKNRHTKTVQVILNNGASCNPNDEATFSIAIRGGLLNLVQAFITANVKFHFEVQKSAILMAAQNGFFEIIKLVFETYTIPVTSFASIFSRACQSGNLKLVQYLFNYFSGYPAEIFNSIFSQKPLQEAAKLEHFDIVEYLLSKPADYTYDIDEALVYASENGTLEMVKLLIKHGANARISRSVPLEYRMSPAINQATLNGHLEVVKYLYEHGGAKRSRMKIQVVEIAAREGYQEIVEFMLTHLQDANLNNAVNMAIQRKHDNIARLLVKHILQHPKKKKDESSKNSVTVTTDSNSKDNCSSGAKDDKDDILCDVIISLLLSAKRS